MTTWRALTGDCRDLMRAMPEASVDAIIADPPYGIGFMGKKWDTFKPDEVEAGKARDTRSQKRRELYGGKESDAPSAAMAAGRYDFAAAPNREFQEWCRSWAVEALRVLKPGGHAVVFGGTRTFHRLTCGLEDAGFEIRDVCCYMFGSGFPKSLDVSKAIDKAAGATREVVGPMQSVQNHNIPGTGARFRNPSELGGARVEVPTATAPATDAARQWSGWGTALKPAWEPIILARKPLGSTVAECVQKHGTGALNIDGCRIETDEPRPCLERRKDETLDATRSAYGKGINGSKKVEDTTVGRWPANILLDPEAAALLDAQSGERQSGTPGVKRGGNNGAAYGAESRPPGTQMPGFGDSGGASRFFFTSKASRREREEGLDGFTARRVKLPGKSEGFNPATGEWSGKEVNPVRNVHPTVKPVDLMSWLCKLVTRPGGTILDPFTGSGSTGVAAVAGGWNFIGLEMEPEYVEIARARIGAANPLFSKEDLTVR